MAARPTRRGQSRVGPAPSRLGSRFDLLADLRRDDLQLVLKRSDPLLCSLEVRLDSGARLSLPRDFRLELTTFRFDLLAFRLELLAIRLQLAARLAVRLALGGHLAQLPLQIRFGMLLPYLRLSEFLRPVCQPREQVRDIDRRGGVGRRCTPVMHQLRPVLRHLGHTAMLDAMAVHSGEIRAPLAPPMVVA
jgi:hypothetical protein